MKNEISNDILIVSIGSSVGDINLETKEKLKKVVHNFIDQPVLEAKHDESLLPDNIYICPPRKFVSIKNNKFNIQELQDEAQNYSGIDKVVFRELSEQKIELEHTVEDLVASNKELKSSNEELLSMNKELQSANEKLKAFKEEVLKGNEILQNSNIDLENLLNSTKIATIFLDEKLIIKNFTPAINQIYDLLPQDVGRSIMSFSTKATNMPNYSYPKDLKIDQVVETEITMPDGRIFLRRKSPYIDSHKKMIGLVVTFVDVSELRRSEVLFKSLANSVPQMIFSTDEKGNYNYFSDQWFAYTGSDASEVKNLGFREYIHPDDLAGAIVAWNEALKGEEVFNYQYRLRNRFGQYRWHQLNVRSVRDHNGSIYRWFGGCTDIQVQKDLELDLFNKNIDILRTQNRFNGVASAIDLGVWYCNLPFDVLNWSDNVKRQFWCDLDEVITIKIFYDRIHPEDRKRTEDAINYSIENHYHYDISYRTVSPKTGEIKWIRAIGWTDYDESGKPIRFDGVTFDNTDATLYMENLRDSEWRYSMASKAAREVIWDWDFSSNRVHWNEAINTQLGYPEKFRDTDALWWHEQIHPEDVDRVSQGIHKAIDLGDSFW
ncbi:MAG: PAS domain-containing protein, partial [Bdellovibrionales bacterium]|nr:PAS domain-containing protein [Bdellovibrionales bacterium]